MAKNEKDKQTIVHFKGLQNEELDLGSNLRLYVQFQYKGLTLSF